MAKAVKLSESIVSDAKIISKAFNRSVAGQIEYWAKIGKIKEEAKAEKLEPYNFKGFVGTHWAKKMGATNKKTPRFFSVAQYVLRSRLILN